MPARLGATSPAPSAAPREGLGRDGERIDREGQEGLDLEGDLVAARASRASTRAATDVARVRVVSSAAVRTNRWRPTRASRRSSLRSEASRCARQAEPSREDAEEHRGRHHLSEHRAPRRAGDAEVEAVDEHELDDQVQQVGAGGDGERRPRVLDAPQVAVTDQGDSTNGDTDRADAQVGDRVREHLARATQRDRRRPGERAHQRGRHQPEPDAQPQPLGRDVVRAARVARTDEEGDRVPSCRRRGS